MEMEKFKQIQTEYFDQMSKRRSIQAPSSNEEDFESLRTILLYIQNLQGHLVDYCQKDPANLDGLVKLQQKFYS